MLVHSFPPPHSNTVYVNTAKVITADLTAGASIIHIIGKVGPRAQDSRAEHATRMVGCRDHDGVTALQRWMEPRVLCIAGWIKGQVRAPPPG